MDYLVEGREGSLAAPAKLVNFLIDLFVVVTGKNQSFFLRFLFFSLGIMGLQCFSADTDPILQGSQTAGKCVWGPCSKSGNGNPYR